MRKEAKLLKALANERRLRMVELLSRSPHTVTEISNEMKLSLRSVSKHLIKLEEVGLVNSQQKSRYVIYTAKKLLLDHIRSFVRMSE